MMNANGCLDKILSFSLSLSFSFSLYFFGSGKRLDDALDTEASGRIAGLGE